MQNPNTQILMVVVYLKIHTMMESKLDNFQSIIIEVIITTTQYLKY